MAHINTIIPETLDPLQSAYRTNRSKDDAISIALNTALSHLDKINTYVRRLLIDYSSDFNTIVQSSSLHTAVNDPGTKHLPLQLDPELSDRSHPGGKGR